MKIGGEILLGAGGLDGSECGLSFVVGLWFGLSEFWSEQEDVPAGSGLGLKLKSPITKLQTSYAPAMMSKDRIIENLDYLSSSTRQTCLSRSKKLIWNHLKDNRLDIIAYLPDLRNEMSCVIYDHSRYTLDSARTASGIQLALYDKYDNTNNIAAVAFLLDSLSSELNATITEKLVNSDSFHVVWLEIMNKIQVQTIERIEAIKKQIKDCCPQQYPGQDLDKLAVDFRADAMELVNAGQYEHNLTLNMLTSYLLAGGTDNEDYRFGLRVLKIKLDEELLAIGYMDKPQADAHMVKEKLHYKDINSGATKPYRKQFDRGE
jgi:hypothetical protein